MQYADFEVLKALLAVCIFGKVSRPSPEVNLSPIPNITFTTEVFEPHSAVYYVRSLISLYVTE